MTLEDNNTSSRHKKKTRKGMDIDLHEHIGSDTEPLTEHNVDGSSSHHLPVHNDSSDDSGDSFCDASDACEPDHRFLAEILEDEHPERLNLLESNRPMSPATPAQSPNATPKPESAPKLPYPDSPGEQAETEDVKEAKKPASVKSVPNNINEPNTENGKEVSESEDCSESVDAFTASPARTTRPTLKDAVSPGSMRKSLRGMSIGTAFFAKPFKGLANKIRRPGNKK